MLVTALWLINSLLTITFASQLIFYNMNLTVFFLLQNLPIGTLISVIKYLISFCILQGLFFYVFINCWNIKSFCLQIVMMTIHTFCFYIPSCDCFFDSFLTIILLPANIEFQPLFSEWLVECIYFSFFAFIPYVSILLGRSSFGTTWNRMWIRFMRFGILMVYLFFFASSMHFWYLIMALSTFVLFESILFYRYYFVCSQQHLQRKRYES